MDRSQALKRLSYGAYLLTTRRGDEINGMPVPGSRRFRISRPW